MHPKEKGMGERRGIITHASFISHVLMHAQLGGGGDGDDDGPCARARAGWEAEAER